MYKLSSIFVNLLELKVMLSRKATSAAKLSNPSKLILGFNQNNRIKVICISVSRQSYVHVYLIVSLRNSLNFDDERIPLRIFLEVE
jgi:hypothetical protein